MRERASGAALDGEDGFGRQPRPRAVALPPAALLTPFNATVEASVSSIQNLVLRVRNLRCTRDLLLPKLVSGEVDVADLDIQTGSDVETGEHAP